MPQIVILARPNGAGKSTAAAGLLTKEITFLNADEIAKGLSGLPSPARDVQAGRLLLQRLDSLQAQNQDIAIETTLASRTLASRIKRLQSKGYRFYLFFFWLPSPEMAIERVAQRVLTGGHDIPEAIIRRRYEAGLHNFFSLYRPFANAWRMYDNTQAGKPGLIAKGMLRIQQANRWDQIERGYIDGTNRSGARNPSD